jgi:hypothetical protein
VIHQLMATNDFPIETFWRDKRSFTITEGPTEILKMTVARHVFKRSERRSPRPWPPCCSATSEPT